MSVTDVVTGRLLTASGKFSDKQVAETLQLLVAHGVARGANAIHIEPQDHKVVVRFRIDGMLRGVHKLPLAALGPLLEQLKTLADLDADATAMPQEGRFSLEIKNEPVDVRLSTMPVLGGEKAVLHLAPRSGALGNLEALGFWGNGLELLHDALARAHGLILVGGPKHAGKTTTLYSLLQLMNNPAHNIATIEEHTTHRLPGINQSYTSRGGITESLQAVLGQDPNVILLGNLPGKAAAAMAIQAAVTGHMILAETHNSGAVASVLHLRALGNEPFLLATALRLSIGQRLVRRLCPSCREPYSPDESELKIIDKRFGIQIPSHRAALHALEKQAQISGLGGNDRLGSGPHGITRLWRANPSGCKSCDRSGYQSRIALTEVMGQSEAIQKILIKQTAPTPAELHKAALGGGFVPLGLDGLVKALRGLATVGDIVRAMPH